MAKQKQFNKNVSIKDLLDAGVQFGHQTHRWNPKMRSYIFEARNGIHVIDLAKTRKQLLDALEILQTVVAKNKSVLFVGTKKQAKSVVKNCAEAADEFYVCERWPGGMLTNHQTIQVSKQKLEKIEKRIAAGKDLPKVELSKLNKLQVKLNNVYSGVRTMNNLPGLLIVVDTEKEHIAVAEANKLGIPIIAIVDTNCNPDNIDHVIPGNDDSRKSVEVILEAMTQSIIDKKNTILFAEGKEKEEKEGDL